MPKLDLEKLRAKRAKVAAELEALAEQEQAELERRAALTGNAVLAHAEEDEAFKVTLTEILDARIKKNRDRAVLGLPPRIRKPRSKSETVTA